MNEREALGNKRDGSVFIFIDVQRADEPAGLVGRLNFDLYIALHISPCCKLGSFVAIGFAFF